jgi:hypothetical protein
MKTKNVAGYSLAVFDPSWEMNFTETYFASDAAEHLISSIYNHVNDAIAKVNGAYNPLAVAAEMKSLTKQCPPCHLPINECKRLPAFSYSHLFKFL